MPDGEKIYYGRSPGMVVLFSTQPTRMDPLGCDGFFVQAVYVDLIVFQLFCRLTGKPFHLFSQN